MVIAFLRHPWLALRKGLRSAEAARDVQSLSSHPRRVGGGEENRGRRNVLRLTNAAERSLRFHLLAKGTFGSRNAARGRSFGFDHAGIYPITSHLPLHF